MKLNKIFIIIISSIIILFGSSCNYREIEKLGIISGVAIDKGSFGKKYLITVEMLDTKDYEKGDGMVSKIYSSEGDSVFEAVRDIIRKSGYKLFWSHGKVMVVSEEVAKEGMLPVLEFINRDPEPRQDMWILIAKGKSKEMLLNNNPNDYIISSYKLDEIMKRYAVSYKFPQTTIWKFIKDYSEEGIEPMVSEVKKVKQENRFVNEIRGSAVFNKDRLIGFIDDRETFYALLVKGNVKRGLIVVNDIGETKSNVSLEIFSNKTKIMPIKNRDKVSIKVNVKMITGISEISGEENLIDENGREMLRSYAEKSVKDNINYVIRKLQDEYKSDIFGFGKIIDKIYPQEWKKIKGENEDYFSNLNFDVDVDIKIKGSGIISYPNK